MARITWLILLLGFFCFYPTLVISLDSQSQAHESAPKKKLVPIEKSRFCDKFASACSRFLNSRSLRQAELSSALKIEVLCHRTTVTEYIFGCNVGHQDYTALALNDVASTSKSSGTASQPPCEARVTITETDSIIIPTFTALIQPTTVDTVVNENITMFTTIPSTITAFETDLQIFETAAAQNVFTKPYTVTDTLTVTPTVTNVSTIVASTFTSFITGLPHRKRRRSLRNGLDNSIFCQAYSGACQTLCAQRAAKIACHAKYAQKKKAMMEYSLSCQCSGGAEQQALVLIGEHAELQTSIKNEGTALCVSTSTAQTTLQPTNIIQIPATVVQTKTSYQPAATSIIIDPTLTVTDTILKSQTVIQLGNAAGLTIPVPATTISTQVIGGYTTTSTTETAIATTTNIITPPLLLQDSTDGSYVVLSATSDEIRQLYLGGTATQTTPFVIDLTTSALCTASLDACLYIGYTTEDQQGNSVGSFLYLMSPTDAVGMETALCSLSGGKQGNLTMQVPNTNLDKLYYDTENDSSAIYLSNSDANARNLDYFGQVIQLSYEIQD